MKMTFPSIITAISVSLVVLATAAKASPCTNTVQNNLDSGPGSLRDALANATDFETITFCPGVTGTIKLTSGQLTVYNGVTIVGPGANVLALDGNGSNGVFYVSSGLPVSISGLTITNGYTLENGGGIDNEQSSLTVSNCVVTGNHGYFGGGIYNHNNFGLSGSWVMNVYNCTLSGNTASFGGALMNDGEGDGVNPVVQIYNSTVSSNSSAGNGDALFNTAGGGAVATLRILNSTFSGNFSGSGAGIRSDVPTIGSATVEIGSTVLNATPLGINGGAIRSLGYNLSSDNGHGFLTATGDQTNTNPLLGPLQLNGGQTPTHALLGGSPAIDAGTNFSGLATDQRGPGFARTVDINLIPNVAGGTDIGAFELQASESHLQPPAITSSNSVTFITGYSNSFRIVSTGVPTPAIYATGTLPAGTGWSTNGILSGTLPLGSGGIYPLTVIASNGTPPMATQYLTLTVVEHCNTVQNNQDSGPGSLRYALANATNFQTITFCTGVTGTIKLASGQLTVGNGVTIVGPGANVLALDGNGSDRVFYVSSSLPVSISGLTITNGYATDTAGGIDNEQSPLTLSNCVVTGNHGSRAGGIYNNGIGGGGLLEIYNCTLSGNYAAASGGAASGGAILNDAEGVGGNAAVHIYNSTISSNSSSSFGGALYNFAFGATATLRIVNSTFSGNTALYGSGIYIGGYHGGSATLDIGSTILNDTALVNDGGGILSLGYNLSSDDGGGFLTATGDQTNTNPLLGPLQLNGGQTPTHALLSGSPAIDAGTNFSGLATDQRGPGYPRMLGSAVDIGAFEHEAPPLIIITSPSNVTFLTGLSNSFTLTAVGAFASTIAVAGTFPTDVSFTPPATLSGIPPDGSGGAWPLLVTATNAFSPNATQQLTLNVVERSVFAAHPNFNTNGLGWALNGDTVNGGPVINSNLFTLTDFASGENRSAWFRYPLYVGAFEASFTYQDVGGYGADGVGFVIQNDPRGTTALGFGGGGLAYAGITNSVAVLLNIYGTSGLMLGTNGVDAYDGSGAPSGKSYQNTAPVNLDTGNPIAVALRYTGGILQVSLTDTVTTANFQTNIPVDIPAFTGTNVAWVGITGSEGGVLSYQTVSNFSYVPLPTLAISSQPGSLVFTWPASVYGFLLQSNPNLNNPAGWASVATTVTQTNNLNQVVIPSPTGSQFYRLVLP